MAFLPHTPADRDAMLAAVGVSGIEDLFADIPEAVRRREPLALPPARSELEVAAAFAAAAGRNRGTERLVSFLGSGFYDRFIPAAVEALAGRGEFATAYTPYQPELSQGTLAAIYEFQTMIASLTGMDVAQASMYDGASALGEAALLALAQTGSRRVLASRRLPPEALAVVRTYLRPRGADLEVVEDLADLRRHDGGPAPAAVLWAYPDLWGGIRDLPGAIAWAHEQGALAVVMSDPVALAVLTPPGAWGADVVVGEGQPLGNPLSYGGPSFGFFTVRRELLRRLPGRLAGATVDRRGRRAFVLTLQAREQHIRREKATSNICSNHALNALMATIHMALLGPAGLREVAELSAAKAHYLAEALAVAGLQRPDPEEPFLYEFVVQVPGPVADLNRYLLDHAGILGGRDLGAADPAFTGLWQLAVTEKRTRAELDRLVEGVRAWMASR
ncbi:MAG: aminomethyl-transferring glycine dehydrogenase subunit GcvPA [Firmicutes bacterium]|nr:aminomethyl-transferring glycine dehydrogenase subunit GcvPA [Bacillota bacterium]